VYDTPDPLGLNVVSEWSITVEIEGACLYHTFSSCIFSNLLRRRWGLEYFATTGIFQQWLPSCTFQQHDHGNNFEVDPINSSPFTPQVRTLGSSLDSIWQPFRSPNTTGEDCNRSTCLRHLPWVNKTLTHMDKLQSDPSGITTLTLSYNGTVGTNIAFKSFAYLAVEGSNAAIFSDFLSLPFNPALNTLRGNIHQKSLFAEIDAALVGKRTLSFCSGIFHLCAESVCAACQHGQILGSQL